MRGTDDAGRTAAPYEEWDAIFREGATDEEIEGVLRHVFCWAWIVRDPLGKVCATGRHATRAEAIRCAFELADAYSIDLFSTLDDPVDEIRTMNGPWRFVLWPPTFDTDPRFWALSAGVFEEEG